jgi:hypothetical protein
MEPEAGASRTPREPSLLAAVVGMATGSSSTTAGTLGVAFIGHPLIAMAYTFFGFRVEHGPPIESGVTTAEVAAAASPSIPVAEGGRYVQ